MSCIDLLLTLRVVVVPATMSSCEVAHAGYSCLKTCWHDIMMSDRPCQHRVSLPVNGPA